MPWIPAARRVVSITDGRGYQWTKTYDALGRQTYEERFDYVLGNWVNRYDITQTYDKNGNRTGYDKDVVSGYESSYGKHYNLSYTFDNVNSLSAITDGDDANYSCAVTSDANLNITQVTESDTRMGGATLYTYFEYDGLNRMTVHKTKRNPFAGAAAWLWTKRTHQYDATGRLVKSNWKSWNDGQQEPSGDTLEHIYAGAKHIQNYDGSSSYGAVWHWAGAQHEHMGPLNSPNPDTASQKTYNLAAGGADESGGGGAGGMSPQRRTSTAPTTEGDQRNLFGQGRPMAKDSSGAGSAWATGTTSQYTGKTGYPVESRLMFEGTVAQSDMNRATDAREKQRVGIFGTGLSYAGSYGRVTSESIGRDLNPLGRGSGFAPMGGALAEGLGKISSWLPGAILTGASGNSINNQGGMGFGGGGSETFGCGCGCVFGACHKPTALLNFVCDCDALMQELRELDCCKIGASAEKCRRKRCELINCLKNHRCNDFSDPCPGLDLCPDCLAELLAKCRCSDDSSCTTINSNLRATGSGSPLTAGITSQRIPGGALLNSTNAEVVYQGRALQQSQQQQSILSFYNAGITCCDCLPRVNSTCATTYGALCHYNMPTAGQLCYDKISEIYYYTSRYRNCDNETALCAADCWRRFRFWLNPQLVICLSCCDGRGMQCRNWATGEHCNLQGGGNEDWSVCP